MKPSTSKVASKVNTVPTTGWLDSDDDDDTYYNDSKRPLLSENALKQQQQHLIKSSNRNIVKLSI